MFLGHYGVAFAAKRAAPRVSLGVLFAAAQLADLIWPVLLLTGAERVRVTPSDNPFLRLSFEWYPWTHSLLMGLVWGALAGALYYAAVRRDRKGALIVGVLVVSHWVLDLIVHVPDLPLYPGGPRVGLGLWRSFAGTMIVEGLIFTAGLALYARATRPADRTGRYAFWALVALLVLLYFGSLGPTPTDVNAIAWGALAGWLLPLFAWWVDRHRVVPALAGDVDIARGT